MIKGRVGQVGEAWRVERQVGKRRRLVLLLSGALVAAVGLDASRLPERQVTTALAVKAIHVYQNTLSPVFDRCGLHCRFRPSCSHYAEVSLSRHGIVSGSWRTLKRVTRCGPWTPLGTIDPAE